MLFFFQADRLGISSTRFASCISPHREACISSAPKGLYENPPAGVHLCRLDDIQSKGADLHRYVGAGRISRYTFKSGLPHMQQSRFFNPQNMQSYYIFPLLRTDPKFPDMLHRRQASSPHRRLCRWRLQNRKLYAVFQSRTDRKGS